MLRTRIKICGIREAQTASIAAQAGADAIGLVFVAQSPRYVSLEQAQKVISGLPAFVEVVALFVNASLNLVRETCERLGVRTVQLHGQESPDYVSQLGPLRVIKAVNFEGTSQLGRHWPGNLVGILLDAPTEDPNLPGGRGHSFDWSPLAQLDRRELPPLILAGGLTAENVGQAIRTVRPYAVDVSSGVESTRGIKDAASIQAFCRAVRQADLSLQNH